MSSRFESRLRGFPLVTIVDCFGPNGFARPLSRFCRFRYAGEESSRAIAIPLEILNARVDPV